MSKQMDIFNGKSTQQMSYDKQNGTQKVFTIRNAKEVLAANGFFDMASVKWYDKFNRFGWVDPFDHDQVVQEFLFFTKPNLNLYSGKDHSSATLIQSLQNYPIFVDADSRHRDALMQLQYSVKDGLDRYNPFMYLLSNAVTSKLDLPGISSEAQTSTPNIMGVDISYRGHSLKSDNGYDFTLSFTDTAYLEIYTMVKIYDEYMRLLKTGEIAQRDEDIIARVIPEQFSIYKFLIGSDGETILFYAKLTGCYFTDVPRSDFGDPGSEGFKYSVSFRAQFVEDNNPMILSEFNSITPAKNAKSFVQTYNANVGGVDNRWVSFPKVVRVNDIRSQRRGVSHDYRIRWVE